MEITRKNLLVLAILLTVVPSTTFYVGYTTAETHVRANLAYQKNLYESQHLIDSVSMVYRHADGTIYFTTVTHNIVVNNGKNLVKTILGSTAANTTGVNLWNYIALTNATFTAAVGDNYCCGGLGNTQIENTYGLAAAQGTYSSTGTGTWTIVHTFTYDGTGGTQTIYGAGLQISASVGTGQTNLAAEAVFSSTAPLSVNGDNVQVTWSMSCC